MDKNPIRYRDRLSTAANKPLIRLIDYVGVYMELTYGTKTMLCRGGQYYFPFSKRLALTEENP